MANAKTIYDDILKMLRSKWDASEAESQAYILLEHFYRMGRPEVLSRREIPDDADTDDRVKTAIERILKDEPIQYVIGMADFYGRKFTVNPDVLIPRPETEELVYLIISQHKNTPNLKLLDIGTGSGIIPITLAKELETAEVYALDISEAALATAQRNAKLNSADVHFICQDILQKEPAVPPCDIWVSNPPYVLELEKPTMMPHVVAHEPSIALFVPNHDPLVFYRRIANLAARHLKQGGKLYLEINEAFGKQTAQLLIENGFDEVTVHQDMQGKDRIVSARK